MEFFCTATCNLRRVWASHHSPPAWAGHAGPGLDRVARCFRPASYTAHALRPWSMPSCAAAPGGPMITTTPNVEGKHISKYCGVVAGEVILSTDVFKDMFAGIRYLTGGARGLQRTRAAKGARTGAAGPRHPTGGGRRGGCGLGLRHPGHGAQHADGVRQRHGRGAGLTGPSPGKAPAGKAAAAVRPKGAPRPRAARTCGHPVLTRWQTVSSAPGR